MKPDRSHDRLSKMCITLFLYNFVLINCFTGVCVSGVELFIHVYFILFIWYHLTVVVGVTVRRKKRNCECVYVFFRSLSFETIICIRLWNLTFCLVKKSFISKIICVSKNFKLTLSLSNFCECQRDV